MVLLLVGPRGPDGGRAGGRLPYKHEVEKVAQSGKGDGGKSDAPIKVAEKKLGDKIAEQLIFAGAIANGELNHDIKRPDGKQYGMPGGKNAEGPNTPEAQASAGVVLAVVAVLSAGARTFYKKLAKALKDGKPLVYSEMKNVGDGVADELAEKLGGHFKKQLGADAVGRTRIALAASLNKNGAIGPYSKMTQFTDELRGSYRAHHILEEQMFGCSSHRDAVCRAFRGSRARGEPKGWFHSGGVWPGETAPSSRHGFAPGAAAPPVRPGGDGRGRHSAFKPGHRRRGPSPVAVPVRAQPPLPLLVACAVDLADRARFAPLEPGAPRRHGIRRAQAAREPRILVNLSI